jgi:hypothetical protein
VRGVSGYHECIDDSATVAFTADDGAAATSDAVTADDGAAAASVAVAAAERRLEHRIRAVHRRA